MNNTTKITAKQAQDMLVITEMYKVAFNHLPDAEGLAYWMNDIANGHSLQDVAKNIATNLPAFSSGHVTDVINSLYHNAINTDAPSDVVQHWNILAVNAVPVGALLYEMSIALTGQPTDAWAGALHL